MIFLGNREETAGATLLVMNYNIRSGIGMDGAYDLDRIAGVIRESEAELIGLQEVDVHWGERSGFENTAQRLADKLKMQLFFAPIYELLPSVEGAHSRQFGVAVLSKHPIVHAVNHLMTRLSTQVRDHEPIPMPGLAEVTVDMKGKPLSVFVTHLDYRADPAIRIVQVKELLDLLQNNANAKIVLGDFNASPEASELSPIFSALMDTWVGEQGFTFPADAPDRKIDYILAGPGIRTVASWIVLSTASDHRPILADLIIG